VRCVEGWDYDLAGAGDWQIMLLSRAFAMRPHGVKRFGPGCVVSLCEVDGGVIDGWTTKF